MDRDAEHLRLLSIFHMIFAGLVALQASIPLIHLCIGLGMALVGGIAVASGEEDAAPFLVIGPIMAFIAAAIVAVGWALAVGLFLAGRCLRKRTHYAFCFAAAVFCCLLIPYGTILGVFTIIVLVRPSVKALFGRADAPPAAPRPADAGDSR